MTGLTRWLKLLVCLVFLGGIIGCAGHERRETAGQYLDDSVVTARVKAAMWDDAKLKPMDIKVETYRGVVQLSGFVDSRETKDRAGEAASKVEGVYDVKNNLIVK